MGKFSLLLVLQVVLSANGVISRHVERIPHPDLAKFFDRINDFADQSALKKEIEEDSEYHPWKKEDVEKLTNLAMNDENALSGVPTQSVTPNSPIRPIYNIAHMVNSVKQIDTWLGYGSNALEVDVSFSKVGTPEYFYHGTPCDAGRYCERWAYIGNYIEALRERTLPDSRKLNRQLVLVMFDVKLKNVKKNSLSTAGEKFVKEILIPLYKDNPTKMKVTISVPNFTLKNFILAVLSRLNAENPDIIQKIGFEISMEWNLTKSHQKEKALRDLGVPPFHAWLSSGITNWSPKLFLDELSSQVEYRDNGNYFSKVYAWTVDKKSTAKTYLEMGLDGIIMNYPGRMNEAMAEINKRKGQTMRLATLDDDPFELVK